MTQRSVEMNEVHKLRTLLADWDCADWSDEFYLLIAQHHLAALDAVIEEAAKIAETSTDGVHVVLCTNIAQAIRALRGRKG